MSLFNLLASKIKQIACENERIEHLNNGGGDINGMIYQ